MVYTWDLKFERCYYFWKALDGHAKALEVYRGISGGESDQEGAKWGDQGARGERVF